MIFWMHDVGTKKKKDCFPKYCDCGLDVEDMMTIIIFVVPMKIIDLNVRGWCGPIAHWSDDRCVTP